MPVASDELIRSHYRQVAQKHGASPRSTMEDDFVREKELECIRAYRALLHARRPEPLQILDLGCGN
ncbi:MAG TPA: hypothetical protein VMI06_01230, partial [Terriglobia bacterium]|nr:hypothetical protein [Terriglobia bacterium]